MLARIQSRLGPQVGHRRFRAKQKVCLYTTAHYQQYIPFLCRSVQHWELKEKHSTLGMEKYWTHLYGFKLIHGEAIALYELQLQQLVTYTGNSLLSLAELNSRGMKGRSFYVSVEACIKPNLLHCPA